MPIYHRSPWGYQAPYMLAAIRGVHPNYATYLMNRSQITIPQVNAILEELSENKRHIYNETDIECLYFQEMNHVIDDSVCIAQLRTLVADRTVLVIAPGNTVKLHDTIIHKYIAEQNSFVITVNFIPDGLCPDLVFTANNRRYLTLRNRNCMLITTSNIKAVDNALQLNYSFLISKDRKDNSGIMALRMLVRLGIKEVALAGFDGFHHTGSYYSESQETYISDEEIRHLNIDMAMQLGQLSEKLDIKYITPTIYK